MPAAAVTGMSPSGRACGCQGHYKFPALHRAQPRPRADNKRFASLPHRLGATPSPAPEPKPSAGRKQRSSTQPLLALEGRPFSLAFAPGQGTSKNPTLSGLSTPCWPESEDEPRVLHTYPRPGSHPRGRGRGPGRRRACARRGWRSPQHRARRSLGLRPERSGGLGSRLLPQGRATVGRQRRDKIKRRQPQSRRRVRAAAPSPAGWSRTAREVERAGAPQPYLFGASTGRRPGLGAGWYGVYPI